GGEVRGGLGAEDGGPVDLDGDGVGPAALLPALALGPVGGLAGDDRHQDAPQVVAVVEAGEAAGGGPAAEAVEGAEGDVLLVVVGPPRGLDPRAGQGDQASEVALPQGLGGGLVARLQPPQPGADGVR